jgi:RNA polymerase sigma-70 factor, ECF subfamily
MKASGIRRQTLQCPEGVFLLPDRSEDVSLLLRRLSSGDTSALDRLTPLIYMELKRMARMHMRRERPGNSFQTTALVHEAWLRIASTGNLSLDDRAQFFALSSQVMRRILIDAARARASAKRGGEAPRPAHLDDVEIGHETGKSVHLIALDAALDRLARIDARKARVIELRFFGGLSVDETAAALGISAQSVMRDWKLAKAWLIRELG